jgi:hypothetical protein
MTGFIGYSMVIAGLPMVFAAVQGADVQLTYTVLRADRYGDRKCRRPIELDGMPFIFNELCGFPDDLRNDLHRGRKIRVVGYGTSMGFFPWTVHLAEASPGP